ncbi:MAG: LysM peptidoglycan-binding domain-containing protein [Nitrososphaerales archaeon]
MNEHKTKLGTTKLIISTILAALFISAVGSAFSSGHQQTASAYSSDPIAVGNWQYDQYDSIIVQEAQNFGLNPFYVKGQIMLESNFNTYAQSSVINAGCGWTYDLGLMQVNPYCNNISPANSLFNPTTNIYYGCQGLSMAYRQLGDLNLALQAYNIGLPAVLAGYRNWAYSDAVDTYAQQFQNEHNSLYGSGGGGAPSGSTYTVQPGDTLSLIGGRYGVSYLAIAQANGIYSPYIIYPGEQLAIPSTGGGSGSWTYTIQPGDTLGAIGQRYGVNWQTISQINGIYSPYIIYPGERLTIP